MVYSEELSLKHLLQRKKYGIPSTTTSTNVKNQLSSALVLSRNIITFISLPETLNVNCTYLNKHASMQIHTQRQTCRQTGKQAGMQSGTEKQAGQQAGRQANTYRGKQTHIHTASQTDRQMHTQGYIQMIIS